MKIDGALLVRQIEAYLVSNGRQKQEFYEATGVNSANLAQWRSGAYAPSQGKIDAIEEYTGMPIDALMYGRPAGTDGDDLPAGIRRIARNGKGLSTDEWQRANQLLRLAFPDKYGDE